MNINDLFILITMTYTSQEIYDKIDEAKYSYVNDNWEEEFEDIFDAYNETGRNEAEDEIINEIINNHLSMIGINDNQRLLLYNKLSDYYNIFIALTL